MVKMFILFWKMDVTIIIFILLSVGSSKLFVWGVPYLKKLHVQVIAHNSFWLHISNEFQQFLEVSIALYYMEEDL